MNVLQKNILAIITEKITPDIRFDDVRFFDSKDVIMIQYKGHNLKVTVADLGESENFD